MTLKIMTSVRRVSAPPARQLSFVITPELVAKAAEMAGEMLKPILTGIKELSSEIATTRSETDRRFRDLEQDTFGHRALRTAPAPVLSAQEERRRKDPSRIFDMSKIDGTGYCPPAGGASFIDVTGITPSGPTKAEIAAKKFDALPAVIQSHALERGVVRSEENFSMLSAAAMLHRAARLAGGPAQVNPSAIGRALGVTTQRAQTLISQAVQQGFVREVPTSLGPGFAALL